MVTVARVVEKIVEQRPFLEEALALGILNYAVVAETMKEEIEQEMNKKVKVPAIMMALRRLSEKLERTFVPRAKAKFKQSDITIKSDLFEITVAKSATLSSTIRKIYDLADDRAGNFLTITQGLYETTIIASKVLSSKITRILEHETVIKKIDALSSVMIRLSDDAVNTVGMFYVVTKALNWNQINIVEIVSTFTEMNYILYERDVGRAFAVLRELIDA